MLHTFAFRQGASATQLRTHQFRQDGVEGENDGETRNVFNVDGTQVTVNPNGAITIGSHTLKPRQTITLGSGADVTTIALTGSGGSEQLIIDGTTYGAHPVVAPPPGSEAQISEAVFTTNGDTITAIYSGGSVILMDGSKTTTIPSGATTTFDGELFKVPPHGGFIAVDGHKVPLTAAGGAQAVITIDGHIITAINAGKSIILKEKSSTIMVKDGAQTTFEGHTRAFRGRGRAKRMPIRA